MTKPLKMNLSVKKILLSIIFNSDGFLLFNNLTSINQQKKNKYIKITKLLRKPVVPTPLNFQWNLVNTLRCLDTTTRMFVIHKLSKRHYNKSLTMKTKTSTGKNQKIR